MVAGKTGQNRPLSRRNFLTRIWMGLGGIVLAQLLAGAIAFFRSGTRQEENRQLQPVRAGAVADFPPGSVTYIPAGHLYLSRLADGGFLAISRKCTHLGCAVPWVEEQEKFQCPCHASVFDRTGEVLKSPAPRALDLHPISFEQGMVMIDLSKTIRRASFRPDQAAFSGEPG